MINQKKSIRSFINEQKQTLTDEIRITEAKKIFHRVTNLQNWIEAKNILIYHSLHDELSTEPFLKSITDKTFFLPRVNGNCLDIVSYNENLLKKGTYNIIEPIGESISPSKLDLIIVPGVAFDKNKNRLGRGKGFYDKLLSEVTCCKIGICYDFQLLEYLPCEDHDIKMNLIVTPKYLIK